MGGTGHGFVVACAVGVGDDHVAAQRKADKQIGEQIDQRTGGAYGSQRFGTGKLAYNSHVGSIIQKLQNAAEHQRHTKTDQRGQNGPLRHIQIMMLSLCHDKILLEVNSTLSIIACLWLP